MNRVQQIRHSIHTARRMTLGLVEDIPIDRWTWPVFPGQNHVAWTLMHLLLTDDWGATTLGQRDRLFVDRYDSTVALGPDPDPARWPAPHEILDMMSRAHARLVGCFDDVTDADLDRSTGGPLAEFAPDLATVLHSHVWHEGFHGGQIAVVRKALDLPPRFG